MKTFRAKLLENIWKEDTPNEIFFYDDVSTKETLLLNSNVHDETRIYLFA